MKPHPLFPARGYMWGHIGEIPRDIVQVLHQQLNGWEVEDQAILAAVRDDRVLLAAVQQARLVRSIPVLCRTLEDAHPRLPLRKVFAAVSLVTGISEPHVRRHYYQERKKR